MLVFELHSTYQQGSQQKLRKFFGCAKIAVNIFAPLHTPFIAFGHQFIQVFLQAGRQSFNRHIQKTPNNR